MNNQLLIKLVKEVRLLFSFLFLCFILINDCFSQDQVTIRHFQRKLEIDHIIIQNEQFKPSIYPILLPDSIYNSGNIRVKKVTIEKYKFEALFIFKENKYTQITYTPKNKNSKLFLLEYFGDTVNFKERKITAKKVSYILD